MWEVSHVTSLSDNGCAICRNQNGAVCLDCQAENENYSSWCKSLWLILLCARKRQGTCFSVLDVATVSNIYAYSVFRNEQASLCLMVTLICNHTFHQHCFLEWARRRPLCPLCAGPPVASQIPSRTIEYGTSFMTYEISNADHKRLRHHEPPRLDAALVRMLKRIHPNGGLSLEQLHQLNPLGADVNQVSEALQSMLNRQFVTYDEKEKLYKYNP